MKKPFLKKDGFSWPTLGQWRRLPEILNKKEKRALFLFSVLAFCSFVFLATSFYLKNTEIKPKAGGTYEFVKQAFGEVPSFFVGWLSWIIANITTSMLIVGGIYYLLPGAGFFSCPAALYLRSW